jgi:hypothetical protein
MFNRSDFRLLPNPLLYPLYCETHDNEGIENEIPVFPWRGDVFILEFNDDGSFREDSGEDSAIDETHCLESLRQMCFFNSARKLREIVIEDQDDAAKVTVLASLPRYYRSLISKPE